MRTLWNEVFVVNYFFKCIKNQLPVLSLWFCFFKLNTSSAFSSKFSWARCRSSLSMLLFTIKSCLLRICLFVLCKAVYHYNLINIYILNTKSSLWKFLITLRKNTTKFFFYVMLVFFVFRLNFTLNKSYISLNKKNCTWQQSYF